MRIDREHVIELSIAIKKVVESYSLTDGAPKLIDISSVYFEHEKYFNRAIYYLEYEDNTVPYFIINQDYEDSTITVKPRFNA